MADTNKPNYSATELVDRINSNKTFGAQIGLAVDYLTMTPQEFNKVVSDMESLSKKSGGNAVYGSDSKGNVDIYLNDTFTDDTSLIRVNRDIKPKSTPLDDPKLEQAAVNFNNLLGAYSDHFSARKTDTQLAAGAALAEYGSRLSPADEVKLLNRAEEINMEFYSSRVGHLMVSTAGDNVKALRFDLPLKCSEIYGHSTLQSRNLMVDRIFRK